MDLTTKTLAAFKERVETYAAGSFSEAKADRAKDAARCVELQNKYAAACWYLRERLMRLA